MSALNSSISVNITISLGTDFSQWFYLTTSDGVAVDLTTAELSAVISKHSNSIDVVNSTADNPVWGGIPITAELIDADSGIYALNIAKEDLIGLKEDKYIYTIVARDTTDDTIVPLVSGLAFVDCLPKVFVTGTFKQAPPPVLPIIPPTLGLDGTLENLEGVIDAANSDSSFLF